jgi:hypothetical protein
MKKTAFLFCFLMLTTVFVYAPVKAQTTYLKTFEKDGTTLKIPSISLSDSVVSYQDTKDFYQFNVTLTKPTAQTVFTFPLETSGLKFYYQPPLNEELNLKEYSFVNATHALNEKGEIVVYRPLNVVGSYAVYRSDGKTGNEYTTGKLYHIYRPLLVDAKGLNSWGNLTVTKTSLTVSCDAEFIKSAAYPIVIDPTFGYTTIGGSKEYGITNTLVYGCKFTVGEAGTITEISAYMQSYNSPSVTCAVYSDDAGAPDALLAVSGEVVGVSSESWYNFSCSYEFSAGTYWIAQFADNNWNRYYDSGDTNQRAVSGGNTYDSFPNPFNPLGYAYANEQTSIYATYTTGAEPQNIIANLPETVNIESTFYTQKNLYRSLTETTTVTGSSGTTKTLIRYSAESLTVTTTVETEKDIHATLTSLFETVVISASLDTVKHISATLFELPETLTVIAQLSTSLVAELTTEDLVGLIILFFVIAIALASAALGLTLRNK